MVGHQLIKRLSLASWELGHSFLGHARRLRGLKRRSWQGSDPRKLTSRHAVYVHYDREGMVHDYVVDQVRQLAVAGFRVTFVSNSPRHFSKHVSRVRPYCREMIWRHGAGYDFGGYKDGIAAIGDLRYCECLLLMNDSVYGPFHPLDEILKTATSKNVDIWGITDSWSGHYHVQSYFIVFFPKALASPAFHKFWRHLPYVNNKELVIRKCEVNLTQKLTRAGLRVAVLCAYEKATRRVLEKIECEPRDGITETHSTFLNNLHGALEWGRPLNPMHHFWDTLISDFKCPFIKRELITKNPAHIIYAWRWPELIARESNYDTELIYRHLSAI